MNDYSTIASSFGFIEPWKTTQILVNATDIEKVITESNLLLSVIVLGY